MTKFSMEEVSPVERRLRIEVPPEDVTAELDRAYRLLSRRVRVPGFRPGKVPRRILEARYKEQVESDVIQSLVEKSYLETLDKSGVHAVAPPKVSNAELKEGEPFRYQAHVEVKPAIDPKDYEGLEIKKGRVDVADAAVDGEIEKLRQNLAEMAPVEDRTELKPGDYAVINFEGSLDGKPFAGGMGEGTTIEIVEGEFTDGKLAALAGAKVGEAHEIAYTFPKSYRLAELANKRAMFKVTATAIKEKRLPPADDELAKDVGAGQTLADLKAKIRAELTERETERVAREVREQIVLRLIEKNPFDVPRSMVDRAVEQTIASAVDRFAAQGLDVRKMNFDVQKMRDSLRPQTLTEIKGALLLEAIAEKAGVAIGDPDVAAKIKEIAQKVHLSEEKVRATVHSEDDGRSLKNRIREEKVLAYLESKAKISPA